MYRKFKFFKILLLVLVAIAALGWIVMSLWNWLIPALFVGVQQIDYLHAVGLLILCKILFGGFRGRGGWHHGHHAHAMHRWEEMTEEEREKFKDGMRMFRGRYHHGH
jgi:hypothetical protein